MMGKASNKKALAKGFRECLIFVIPLRLERRTCCLEGSCSIQLSYGTIVHRPVTGRDSKIRTCDLLLPKQAR